MDKQLSLWDQLKLVLQHLFNPSFVKEQHGDAMVDALHLRLQELGSDSEEYFNALTFLTGCGATTEHVRSYAKMTALGWTPEQLGILEASPESVLKAMGIRPPTLRRDSE